MFRKNALGVALDESKRYEDSIVSLTDALDLVSEEARKAKDEVRMGEKSKHTISSIIQPFPLLASLACSSSY